MSRPLSSHRRSSTPLLLGLLCLPLLLLLLRAPTASQAAPPHALYSQEVISTVQRYEYARDKWPQLELQSFVESLLSAFEDEDWLLDRQQCETLLKKNFLLTYMVALSSFGSTDATLEKLAQQLQAQRASPKAPTLTEDAAQWNAVSSTYCKAMSLYSTRSRVNFDALFQSRSHLFSSFPFLSNNWYSSLLRISSLDVSRRDSFLRLQPLLHRDWYRHFLNFDEHVHSVLYGVSYAHPQRDRFVKKQVNMVLQHVIRQGGDSFPQIKPSLAREPRLVAVVSQFWFRRHSVYRTFQPYLRALQQAGYRLVLFQVGRAEVDVGREEFEQVEESRQESDLEKTVDIARKITSRPFAFVFYPSIGMSWVDVFLSNMRLAPIQLAGLGHSVSGFGNQIDAIMSGEEVEILMRKKEGEGKGKKGKTWIQSVFPHHVLQKQRAGSQLQPIYFTPHYTEPLLLLPGQGVIHTVPDFPPLAQQLPPPKKEGVLILNLSASPQKVNHPHLLTLAGIVQQLLSCSQSVAATSLPSTLVLRLFPHLHAYLLRLTWMHNVVDSLRQAFTDGQAPAHSIHYEPEEEQELQPEQPLAATFRFHSSSSSSSSSEPLLSFRVEFYPALSYAAYMELLGGGDLSLESAHYGGCNTVIDSLYVGVPFVSLRGEKWYNRVGSTILQQWLPDSISRHLLTNSSASFQQQVVRLILDTEMRKQVTEELRAIDVKQLMLEKQGLNSDGSVSASSPASSLPLAFDWLQRHHQQLPSLVAPLPGLTIAQQQAAIHPKKLRTPVFILRQELEQERGQERAHDEL